MPSGSHGGGGGGHFGGGGFSSSGGSHFSGGSSGGSGFRGGSNRGPRTFVFFGRSYSVSSGVASVLSMLAMFFMFVLMFLIVTGVILGDNNNKLAKIKADYNYYQAMIVDAENNPDLQKTAVVTDKFYNESAKKWYYTYRIKDTLVDGYTFSLYDDTEIKHYSIGKEIPVAVDRIPVTPSTDSIPMDYKNTILDQDGEYVMIKKSAGNMGIIIAVLVAIELGLVAAFVMVIIKKIKKPKEQEKVTETSLPPLAGHDEINKKYKCSYCGSRLKLEDEKCPNCGASLDSMK